MEKKPSFAEFIKKEIHTAVNFLVGTVLVLGVLLLPEGSFGRIVQIILGLASIAMLVEKTFKLLWGSFLHFSLEDGYIFLSSIVILTLVIWLPSAIFGLSVKIAFGIAGLVIIVSAISTFLKHVRQMDNF